MDKTTKTSVMTTEQTIAWLKYYFIGNNDWELIYSDALTAIYNWNLDNDVEVITTIEVDTVLITVNFYKDAYSGTPYRTGTITFDDI